MNKERYDRLTAAGIQIEEALERFMDSEAMFERFLGKFLEDETYRQLKEALEKGDIETSIMKSHTLKGRNRKPFNETSLSAYKQAGRAFKSRTA